MVTFHIPWKFGKIVLVFLYFSQMCYGQHNNTFVVNDSLNQNRFKVTSFIIPAVFITYGFIAPDINAPHQLDLNTNAELREDYPMFASKLDNYLRYAPVLAVYGMDLAGLKSKHNFIDRTAILLLADLIMFPSVDITKSSVGRIRPGGGNHSFPSSHASIAFMTAEFMHQEYKDDHPLYSLLGYTTATATAILRLYNGAHWFSDVVAGAGYGIISTKLSYIIYPVIKKLVFHEKPINAMITPFHQDGYTGLAFIHQF